MAARHTGHSFFVSSAVRMQSLQYVWPQGVVNGLTSWSQQMGQRSAASERRALERVIAESLVRFSRIWTAEKLKKN